MKDKKGFTLIEMIITIAILGTLSSIIVPTFAGMIQRTRIKVDIQSIQNVQNMIDIYITEHDGEFPGGDIPDDNSNLKAVFQTLLKEGYLRKQDFDEELKLILQTSGAKVQYRKIKEHIILVIPYTLKDQYEQLLKREKGWVEVEQNTPIEDPK